MAMGGNEDGSGNIDADKLIYLLKNELKLTLDIEEMVKMIDEDASGEIEYGEFASLLNNDSSKTEIKDFRNWFSFK